MLIHTLLTSVALAASVSVSPGDDIAGLTGSLQPGDVVLFTAGNYTVEGTVNLTGQGTDSEPIAFRAQDPGTVVLQNNGGGWVVDISDSSHLIIEDLIFEGDENAEYNGQNGLRIANSSNVTLQRNTVRNVWGDGIRIDGDASNITVRDNHVFNAGSGTGIEIGCGDGSCWLQSGLVEFNQVHDVSGTGVYLHPGTQGVRVQHNVVYRTGEDGIRVNDTQFGDANTIYGNAIWQTEDDGLHLEGAALVQNNVIFEIGDDGIYTNSNYDSLYDLRISHNTVARTDGHAAYLEDWYDRDGLVFANNALSNPTGYGLYWSDEADDPYYPAGETSNYIRNNVVTGLVEGFDRLNRPDMVIPGGGVGDFEDLDNFDFYPTPSSELRDAADPSGEAYLPPEDFNGTQRDGESPDVGAYEYDGEGNPGWIIQEGFKEMSTASRPSGSSVSTGCCSGNSESGTTQAWVLLPLLGLGALRRRRRQT